MKKLFKLTSYRKDLLLGLGIAGGFASYIGLVMWSLTINPWFGMGLFLLFILGLVVAAWVFGSEESV